MPRRGQSKTINPDVSGTRVQRGAQRPIQAAKLAHTFRFKQSWGFQRLTGSSSMHGQWSISRSQRGGEPQRHPSTETAEMPGSATEGVFNSVNERNYQFSCSLIYNTKVSQAPRRAAAPRLVALRPARRPDDAAAAVAH